ncbi:putative addiction module antidote protein [Bradyrhizobium sp. 182]|uniref:putative addiction module antidote protein n=1 Tax=unclassified Bradyrhizobium TaxID=2631580 RepID=UPI001FFB0BB4|nr:MULTISPECIES: putative addiction module antidote protein [unclassified Bradyrhizobium]MCK1527433.1 putative addiction module antidote protein [Bradyrhizobium sp. 182]MCK1666343.1 putative addiction module antidote protein [Bradyrhizobium sp. 153]MCK1758329.1 putative addiction module antidote protein [Bradyrhizobium sp. 137]
MTKTFRPNVPSQLAVELNEALASGEPHTICGVSGRHSDNSTFQNSQKKTGLQRTSIYRAFGDQRLPNFSTILSVLTAMGLQIKLVPRTGGKGASRT